MPNRKITQEEWISKITEKNPDLSFPDAIYLGHDKKTLCYCVTHKDIDIRNRDLKEGKGCPKCRIVKRNQKVSSMMKTKGKYKTIEEFSIDANTIHNNLYDYSESVFVSSKIKMDIRCIDHGIFSQIPGNHLRGQGCPKCAKNVSYTNEEFINLSNEVHNNKYKYPYTEYKKSSEKVVITCEEHGNFSQTPNSHLRGRGCPRCARELNGVGYNEKEHFVPFLKKLVNLHIETQYPVKIDRENYYIDAYIPEINLAIEYDEEQHYYKVNLVKDKVRQVYIEKALGCDFLRIDDREFMENPNLLENKMLEICEAKLSQG